jgi:uncharacterized protein
MSPEVQAAIEALLQILTLMALLIGLVGLVIPVFPGLTIMWLGTLVYALLQNSAGLMTGWDWFLFGLITLLMIVGNVVDNLIIARKMRDKYVPWSSIIWAFIAGIIASLFFTPIIGLVAAPVGLYVAEQNRLKDTKAAIESTKAYMVGWGWAFLARFLIGLAMIAFWMFSAWVV